MLNVLLCTSDNIDSLLLLLLLLLLNRQCEQLKLCYITFWFMSALQHLHDKPVAMILLAICTTLCKLAVLCCYRFYCCPKQAHRVCMPSMQLAARMIACLH
jgi:hypothetical protein